MSTDSFKLEYFLLPSTTPPPAYVDLHNQTFRFWMACWRETFLKLGIDDSHLVGDFVRQDVISCLCVNQQVVGSFLYSFFNFEALASQSLPYFGKTYTPEFFEKLRELGVRNLMTTHYLAVHPEWRKSAGSPLPIGLLLAGLSNRIRDDYGMDAGIGPTRTDTKVADLFYAFGGQGLIKGVINHNAPCDLVANLRGRTYPHQDPHIRKIIDHLWNQRVDLVKNSYLETSLHSEFQPSPAA